VKRLSLCLAVLALAGCGSSGTTAEAPSFDWPGPPDAKADGTIDVASYNDFLAKGGDIFADSPVTALSEFLQLGRTVAESTSVVATAPPEDREHAAVVATLDGLLDDSVRAARYDAIAVKDPSGTWRLVSVKVTFKCQARRGHQNFSVKLCS
jgi:hypothetical protein